MKSRVKLTPIYLSVSHHFLEKNDMIFPWLAFPGGFLALAPDDAGVDVDDAVDAGVGFLAGGASSSENDSHPCSCTVTAVC